MLTGYTIMLLQFTNDHFCGNVFTVYPLGNKDMYRQMNKRTNTLFVMTEKWPWSVGPSLGNMALGNMYCSSPFLYFPSHALSVPGSICQVMLYLCICNSKWAWLPIHRKDAVFHHHFILILFLLG